MYQSIHNRNTTERNVITTKRPVLNKRDFVRRFMAGEFGNKGPNWDTLEEWKESCYAGLVHIRSRHVAGAGPYNVEPGDVEKVYASLGASPQSHYLAGMAPTPKTLFQGELALYPEGLTLYYSTVTKPMRDSLREGGKQVQGIIANSLLRRYMDPTSYDWVMDLLVEYPDHVVEFSVYDCRWGTLPHLNTVVWEVRRY